MNRAGVKSVPDWQNSGNSGGFMHSHVLHVSRPPSAGPDRPGGVGRPLDPPANPFDMPSSDRTLQLVLQYFENTGLLFPYIHRESFLAAYHDVAAANFRTVRRSWLGLLNMILAMSVSTSYLDDLGAQRRMAESGVFFRRAMALCEKQIRFGASLEIGLSRVFLLGRTPFLYHRDP